MRRIITRTVLAGSGALLGVIGGALMIAPREFLQLSHVFVERDPGLMSELTAPGGILLVTSAFLLFGAVNLRFANLALLVGALVYGSYGIGRLVSMALHGFPSASLIAATVIELGVALLLAVIRVSPTPEQRPVTDGSLSDRFVA